MAKSQYALLNLCLILISFQSYAQNGPALFNDIAMFGGIDQTPDGGYVLAGNSGPSLFSSDKAIIVKTDRNRQVVKRFELSALSFFASDVKALNDGYAVLGTLNSALGLIRLDTNGQLLWAQRYEIGGSSIISNTVELDNNGGFLISSLLGNYTVAIKTNSLGVVQWSKGIAGGFSQIRGTAIARNGDILMTGDLGSDPYVARLRSNGDFIWAKRLSTPTPDCGLFIRELRNGDIGISGYQFGGGRSGYIFRLSGAGTLLWTQNAFSRQGYFLNIAEAANGELQVSGDIDNGGQVGIGLATFSPDGTLRNGYFFEPSNRAAATFQGRGKSHLIDRQGRIHVVGSTTTSPAKAYWSMVDNLSNTVCDKSTLPFQTNADAFADAAEPNSINNYSILTGPLTVTARTVAGCQPAGCSGQPSNYNPRILAEDSVSICAGIATTTLSVTSSNSTSILWSTGQSGNSINVSNPGTYWVRVTDICGTASDTIRVIRRPSLPIRIDSSGPLRFCAPGRVNLLIRGQITVTSIRWSSGQTDSAITVTQSGLYHALVTYSNGCQRRTDTVRVSVLPRPPKPIVNPNGTVSLCDSNRVDLRVVNQGQNLRYSWSSGQTGANITALNTGKYTVSAISAEGCISSSDTVYIIPDLAIKAGPDVNLCQGDSTMIGLPAQPGYQYVWGAAPWLAASTGSINQVNTQNLPILLYEPTRLVAYLQIVNNDNGCQASDSVIITVYPRGYQNGPNGQTCPAPIEIPNLITATTSPSVNDAFIIKNIEFYPNNSLVIYSRYGRAVYKQTGYRNTFTGDSVPPGVYFYRLELKDEAKAYTGWVEILK